MESVSNEDSSLSNIHIGMPGPTAASSVSHSAVSDQQNVSSDQVSYVNGSEDLTVSNKQLHLNQRIGGMGPTSNDMASQRSLLPTKRKAAVEPLSLNSLSQQSSVANKRTVQLEPNLSSPGSSQLSKRHTQSQSVPNTPGSVNLPNKKMTRTDSTSNKSGSQRVQTPKSRSAAQEISPKVQSGSNEAVRSKMRETLASALSVGCQIPEKAPSEGSPRDALAHALEKSQPAGSSASSFVSDAPPQSSLDTVKESSVIGNIRNSEQTGKNDGQEPQYNYVMPDADGSFSDTFFDKDELLQGNGLSWAWDMDVSELKEVQADEKPNSVHKDVSVNGTDQGHVDVNTNGTEQIVKSPDELAFKIEAELFKLFGGVSKKYKEKGRSLMFNLKDRNNPELREKVLSGVISPERLCSMTPEELASKELSEWRMAKAEELDKMIVLQDSDVDVRRLVKKTHKGEYQVEVEQDDAASVEVSVGSGSLTRFQPKKKTDSLSSERQHEVREKKVAEGEKSRSANKDASSSLAIPADGSDFMQELTVDDFKDDGFLPPIVSLDEFMESLDSEPPFQNLPVDAEETKPATGKGNSEAGDETGSGKVSSILASADPVGSKAGIPEQMTKKTAEALRVKTHDFPGERTSPTAGAHIGERVWDGELQLTISSSVLVIGLFRSGEKTSTKEWPTSVEIKGRVRLDAFEKFLQELPMSRSRAVMVVHFLLKDTSSEMDRASLSEAVDSYVVDERLGFGEPIPGVELYFCPPHIKIVEMLGRNLSKNQADILKPTDNGLIGVVVWRRPYISSAFSPNSSSHHKHHRTNNFSTRRHDNINGNTNSNLSSKSSVQTSCLPANGGTNNDDDDEDDIPPGFGPGAAARDEDDLPEFNFSGNSNPSGQKLPAQSTQSNLSKPEDQMRQLIYRYGQTGNVIGSTNVHGNRGVGVGTRPWNKDDDDDDIPEWQPELLQNQQRQLDVPPMCGVQQPPLRLHVGSQIRPPVGQVAPFMNMQPAANVGRWVPPLPPGPPPNVAVQGQQHYGGQWRQDAPRSRGF